MIERKLSSGFEQEMLSTIKKHIDSKNGREAQLSDESVEKLVLTFMSNFKKELESKLNQ